MEDIDKLKRIEEKYKQRNKYINTFQKDNYDRVVILFRKGQKQELEKSAKDQGFKTVSDYIKALVDKDRYNSPVNYSDDSDGLPFG